MPTMVRDRRRPCGKSLRDSHPCSAAESGRFCFVSALQMSRSAAGENFTDQAGVEAAVRQWGERIFSLMGAADPPSLFSKKGFYGALMDWAMRDEHFKTQLFRFVDVLPTLNSSAEITRH